MAAATTNIAARALWAPLALISRIARFLRVWRDFTKTANDLNGLSRRELADIGVEGDAEEFAWRLAEDRNRL